MLAACLTAIRLHHPDAAVHVGLRGDDSYARRAHELCELYADSIIVTPGNGDDTDVVMRDLLLSCETDYAVYLEADCLLLKPITSFPDFVGIEEDISWPEGRPGERLGPNSDKFRYAPGMHTASYFQLNVKRFQKEVGIGAVEIKGRKFGEPYYGLSAGIRDAGWHIDLLPVTHLPYDYGYATAYGDQAVHMWFGAWRLRDNVESASGVPREYIAIAEANLLTAFWCGTLESEVKKCMGL